MARLLRVECCAECLIGEEVWIRPGETWVGCRIAKWGEEYGLKQTRLNRAPSLIPDWCPLPEEVAAIEWIPVGERLPERRGQYPVVVSFPDDSRYSGRREWLGRKWEAQDRREKITHWLDIPPLPEEATSES